MDTGNNSCYPDSISDVVDKVYEDAGTKEHEGKGDGNRYGWNKTMVIGGFRANST